MEVLIGQCAQAEIRTTAGLGEYHRRFLLISCYLISKGRMATQEQSRIFFRGLPLHLEAPVRQHLQARFVNHFPDDPYLLSDIHAAASYVLACSTPAPSAPNPSISTADLMSTKLEALTTANLFSPKYASKRRMCFLQRTSTLFTRPKL
jgi:hypothetical protein